jgi:hypothetical protein
MDKTAIEELIARFEELVKEKIKRDTLERRV